jgi:hypothetical protein
MGRDTEIRVESFRRVVDPLIDRNVVRLIIESREGRESRAHFLKLTATGLRRFYAPGAHATWHRNPSKLRVRERRLFRVFLATPDRRRWLPS